MTQPTRLFPRTRFERRGVELELASERGRGGQTRVPTSKVVVFVDTCTVYFGCH